MVVKVALMPEYPFPIAYGGIERRMMRSLKILQSSEIDVFLLDTYNPNQYYDLLHIFGSPPHLEEVIEFASGLKPVIIDSVSGAGSFSVKDRFKKLAFNILSTGVVKTDFTRMKNIYNNVDKILCVNATEKNFIEKMYDLNPSKILTVNKPVDNNFFADEMQSNVSENVSRLSDYVLFIGSITRRKNPLLLARALTVLNMRGVFVGSRLTNELSYFHKFMDEVQRGRHVWFDTLDPASPDIVSLYKRANIFCLPSYHEGQPHVVLEALASGCPVLLGQAAYTYNDPLLSSIPACPISLDSLIENIPLAILTRDSQKSLLPEEYTESYYRVVMTSIYKSYL